MDYKFNKALGKACAEYRESLGLTQKQLSLWSGVSVQNLSKFECGRSGSTAPVLAYIDQGFKFSNFRMNYNMRKAQEEAD